MDNYKENTNEETIDVKNLLYKFLARWYLFAISLVITLVIAFTINRWSQYTYEMKTSILIKDEQSVLDSRFSSGLGLYSTQYRIANEIGILKSFEMTRRAIERLDFGVDCFLENRFYQSDLYKSSPFRVLIDSASPQPVNVKFNIILSSASRFRLSIDEKNVGRYDFKLKKYLGHYSSVVFSGEFKFYEKIKTRDFSFTIIPQDVEGREEYTGKKLSFRLNSPDELVKRYRTFTISSDKTSSIISVSIKGENISRLADFLNTLTAEYLKKGIEKKNLIAENTIKFIDSQVGEISDSLNFSENLLQNYRSENRVMNMDFQAQQAMTALEDLKNQRAEILVKARYYEYLKKYLNLNKDGQDLVAPSALGINDPVLSNLIEELTRLFGERLEMMFNSKKDNPYLSAVDLKISAMKKTILENIGNLIGATDIALQDVDQRISQVSERVNKLPETQRQLFGFERKFKLNDALYTYLLTKRSEMQIAKASYLPDNEVLDAAQEDNSTLIAPNPKRNYLIALLLGLGIPVAFLLLKDYLNDKILTNEDVEKITDFPILGYVVRNKEKSKTVAFDCPMSLTSESIRSIRTNFQFITNEKKGNMVLITSSMMNEGKTFISINMALSFALNSKKCILLSFDLRKPKIIEYLDIPSEKGISNYLSSGSSLNDIILTTRYPNLDVIAAGPVPPNPNELISGEKTKELFRQLKESYDYIFVDTPPVGMIADALILMKYSDINIYVIRYDHTLKKVFSNVMQNFRKRGINNINLIINDIPVEKRLLSYSQAYGYGYGYGYGYYSEENTKSSENQNENKRKNIIREIISKTGSWS